MQPDRSARGEFQNSDVVAAYIHRPEYSDDLYRALLEIMPARRCIFDLGCGPGKMARALAAHVDEVLAVDPSSAMLELGRKMDRGVHPNIRWINAFAEDVSVDEGALDLVVAGAAIHWTDPARLFPKLLHALAPGAPVAIVEGDVPTKAQWLPTYRALIQRWVERLGGVWQGEAHRALMTAHAPWIDLKGEASFSALTCQSLEDLIASQHSRATFSLARMGDLADAFDADLREALGPWTRGGMLSFEVETRLTWGRPRSSQIGVQAMV